MKKLGFLIGLIMFALSALPIFATELSGQLNTGFGNNTIQGTVVSPSVSPSPSPTPTPTPSPSSGGGGGGGGGGSTSAADINRDGKVDILDFNTVIVNWGTSGGAGDLNSDGTVDILDFNMLMANWS